MEQIGSLILAHIVDIVFAIIIAGFGFFFKRYIELEQKHHAEEQVKFYSKLQEDISKQLEDSKKESKKDDAELQGQINIVKDEMTHLKKGLLSVQGKEFKAECRRVLDENHILTLDEFEQLEEDHAAYNGLGGNHKGDSLFELVKKKAESTLTKID